MTKASKSTRTKRWSNPQIAAALIGLVATITSNIITGVVTYTVAHEKGAAAAATTVTVTVPVPVNRNGPSSDSGPAASLTPGNGTNQAATVTLVSYTTPTNPRAVKFSQNSQDEVDVPNKITVDGTMTSIDQSGPLWAMITEQGAPTHYIYNGPCSIPGKTQPGHFYCSAQSVGRQGQDIGTHWTISVVQVSTTQDADWRSQLKQGNNAVGVLPSDITLLATTSVVRV